jgi:hypothetical protein
MSVQLAPCSPQILREVQGFGIALTGHRTLSQAGREGGRKGGREGGGE